MSQKLRNKIMGNPWFARYYDFRKLNIVGLRDNLERQEIYSKFNFKGANVLDVGCNLGKNFIFLDGKKPKNLIGIDLPLTINLAKKVAHIYNLKNTQYFPGDLNKKDWYAKLMQQTEIKKYDYSLFVSVYGTKELFNRDKILNDLIKNTKKVLFFEGHHLENHHIYSKILLKTSCLCFEFEGYLRDKTQNSISGVRPFYCIKNFYATDTIIFNKVKSIISNTGRVVIGIEGLAGSGKTSYLKKLKKSLDILGLNMLIIDDLQDDSGKRYEPSYGHYKNLKFKIKKYILKGDSVSLSHTLIDKKFDIIVVSDYRLRKYIDYSDITIKIISKNRKKNIENRGENIQDFSSKNISTKHYTTNNFYTFLND